MGNEQSNNNDDIYINYETKKDGSKVDVHYSVDQSGNIIVNFDEKEDPVNGKAGNNVFLRSSDKKPTKVPDKEHAKPQVNKPKVISIQGLKQELNSSMENTMKGITEKEQIISILKEDIRKSHSEAETDRLALQVVRCQLRIDRLYQAWKKFHYMKEQLEIVQENRHYMKLVNEFNLVMKQTKLDTEQFNKIIHGQLLVQKHYEDQQNLISDFNNFQTMDTMQEALEVQSLISSLSKGG